MKEIKTHIDAIDMLNSINCDILAISHITMFMGIGSKEFAVERQELWLLCDMLERIAKQTKDVEAYLQNQRQ